MTAPISRESVVEAIRSATEPLDWARALWVGGSASFGRVDAWSDVDLGLAVIDDRVADGFDVIESALASLTPIEVRWIESPPTHEKPQRMYRLAGGAPLVDLAVLPLSTPPASRFVERRRHGTPVVLFDKDGFTADVPADGAAWRARLKARLAYLEGRVAILRGYPVKSARRGDVAEAVAFYQSFVLNPLVEALRIRHDPWRHDFGVRYLRYDLPEDVRRRVEALWLVRDLDDLLAKREQAEAWFREVVAGLDVDAIELRGG